LPWSYPTGTGPICWPTACTRCVVVDNGSTDGSVALVTAKFPKVHLIKLDHNTGFTGGVNTGIAYALEQKFEAIALLNNDAVADKDWLKHLAERLKSDAQLGIVTAKMLRTDKKHLDDTGDFYTTLGLPFPRGRNHLDTGQYDTPEPVFAASGGASLYRAKLFKAIGVFDQTFFAYLEDVDLSWRAQLAGFGVFYEPTALVYHHIGATSSKMGRFARYHFVKNFIYTYNKNMPGHLFWKYKPLFLFQLAKFGLGALRDGLFLTYLKAVGVAVLHLPATLRKRQAIQKARRVSPRHIDQKLIKQAAPKIPPLPG
jgi:GT2 family glycosyltransferase